LDLGCGIGEVADHVQDRSQYFGVDVNPYCVNYLLQKSLWAKLGSAYEIPLNVASVDVVIFSHVLEHLDDPRRAMKEILRVLKPAGILIIIVPTIKGFRRDATHRIFYNKDRLQALADENNYTTISVSSFPPASGIFGKISIFFRDTGYIDLRWPSFVK